jgi:hypothetical protein
MPSYYNSSSTGRQDSGYSHDFHGYSSSTRTGDPSYGSSSRKYDSSSHRDYDSSYASSRDRAPSPLHHTFISRAISPPCSYAEFPRRTYSHSDHRSVSPLGSSRFEQSRPYSSSTYSSSASSRAAREVRETPSYGQDGYYGSAAATEGFTGKRLSRSNAVRRRDKPQKYGESGEYGSEHGRKAGFRKPDLSREDFSRDRY